MPTSAAIPAAVIKRSSSFFSNVTGKLEKYADLRQKGLLTEEEFQKRKADILSQM
jgi:hypothetical protein